MSRNLPRGFGPRPPMIRLRRGKPFLTIISFPFFRARRGLSAMPRPLRAIVNAAGRIGRSGLRRPRASETGGRLEFLLTLVAPVTLTRIPWHRECTGVLNVNPDVQRLAAIDQLEALHDVELGRVGRTEIVDIGPVVKAYGVDHQRVTVFIMPDGFAVPRRLRTGGVGYVQVDVT